MCRPRGASPGHRKRGNAANAGIRLKRNFAEKLEDLNAFASAELIPNGIRYHGCEHDVEQRSKKTQVAGTRERARREQQRHRRKRQPQLLGENPSEQQYVSMMEEEFERAMHGGAGSAISGYFVAKGAVCPQWPAMTNSAIGLRVLGASSRSFKG